MSTNLYLQWFAVFVRYKFIDFVEFIGFNMTELMRARAQQNPKRRYGS